MDVEQKDWADRAKLALTFELKRRKVRYKQLARRLEAIGVIETDRSIARKISRGTFTYAFWLQIQEALDDKTLADASTPAEPSA